MVLTFSLDQLGVDFEVKLTNCTATGAITSAEVLAGGTAYVNGESITLTGVTSGASDATATVVASTSPGPITGITIVSGGSGYTDGETLTVVGGTGSSGTGTASVVYDTNSISTVTIEFTKPDGTTLSKDATLITDPDNTGEFLIQYRNIPPETSILDLSGQWEYAGGAILDDGGSNFTTSETTVFWVV